MSVVRLTVATRSSNILISGKIIKEMPGSVASGTHCSLQATACTLHINNAHACNNMTVTKIYRAVICIVHFNNTDTPTTICRAAVYTVRINSVS